MARQKATITVDREKLAEARQILGARSASDAVDIALSEIVRRGRLARDIAAYTKTPATESEMALGQMEPDWADLADDTDWDAQWPAR